MSSQIYNNHQNQEPYIDSEEYSKLKTLLIKRRKYAKCYSCCILLSIIVLSIICILSISFNLTGHHHHHHHHKNHKNSNNHYNNDNLEGKNLNKMVDRYVINKDQSPSKYLNQDFSNIFKQHNKLNEQFTNEITKKFEANSFGEMINKIHNNPERSLRKYHKKHDRTHNKFNKIIKIFRIFIIVRSIILITLWLINGVKGYVATKNVDIIQARKFKNLNTCLIIYKIIESTIILCIIGFAALKQFQQSKYMIKLNDETIFQALIYLLILLISIILIQISVIIPRNYYNSLVITKRKLGNQKYNVLRNELLGKAIESDRHTKLAKSDKISENNTVMYQPNNISFIPQYNKAYPSQQLNQQIDGRQLQADKLNHNTINNNILPESINKINPCSSSLDNNTYNFNPTKLPLKNNMNEIQQAPYYNRNYVNAVGLNQNQIFGSNDVNFNNLNTHMLNTNVGMNRMNENRIINETNNNLYPSINY